MSLSSLLDQKRIVVCAGTGGVGKTSVAAALGVGAARRGRRVLVLTIDPSRRLAEALGIRKNTPEPVPLDPEQNRLAGIEPPGSLSVWVLDPKRVCDQTVRRLARSPEEAQRLLENSVYRQVTAMIAGMQEYTAMEALHGFVAQGTYDLMVLDTPPSRNALNFLDAPVRLAASIDSRIIDLVVSQSDGRVAGTTRKFVGAILGRVFGEEFFSDLQVFFNAFGAMFVQLSGSALEMRERLTEPDVTFVLVGTAHASLDQAEAFQDRLRKLEMPLGAMVLNRSLAAFSGRPPPDDSLLPRDAGEHHRSALAKLEDLARQEAETVTRDQDRVQELEEQAGVPVVSVPELGQGVDDVAGLGELARWLFGER